ncbi:MAG: hypothetical protein ABFS28_08140 [Bacteroidota bacterium]
MRITPLIWITCTVLLLSLPSCVKYSGDAKGEVELYLLESYENLDQSCAIDEASVEIRKHPLIRYSDFISYNSEKHIFTISDEAAEAVKDLEHSVHGLPFAVIANEELVYTGYFWPSFSSAMCQWIVIDPPMIFGDNELRVELGYPGQIEGVEIPDERNNEVILDIFRRDNKLIE